MAYANLNGARIFIDENVVHYIGLKCITHNMHAYVHFTRGKNT